MNMFVLETDLFPETELMEELLTELQTTCDIYRHDATQPSLTDNDWDRALEQLLSADHIITT